MPPQTAPSSFVADDTPSSFVADESTVSAPTATTTKPAGEGFWESLGHTFGIGKEEAEARRKELKEHPVRSILKAAGGPAVQMAEGVGNEFMRSTRELGQAVDELRQNNPALAGTHAAYAIPIVGAGLKRGVEQLGPNEKINRAEVGTALGTAIQAAPAAADVVGRPIVSAPAKITESLRSSMKRGAGASPLDIKDVAEEGAKKVQEHAEATQEAANEQKSREALEQSALRGKTEEIAKQQSAERLKAKAKDVAAQREHQQAVGETKRENEAALRAQGKIPVTREKLQKSVQELQGQIETARENALKVGNDKYATVNEALNPIQANPEAVQGALANATEALKGSHAEPTLIRSMMAKFERNDPWTYEDLQGDYSRLGKELSKGTLPGDEFHAYDVLHEALGDEMQRIADSQGLGGQLKAARDYWRRMKQTFGKPYNPTDAANVTLEKTAGSVMRDAEQANRLRLLGSFDKTIPQTAEHIANLQKGLESLPKEAPTREVIKPLPERPTPAGSPKFEGTPEELARQAVKQPERPEYPNRPEQVNLQERQAQQIMERGAKITHSPSASMIGHAMTGFGSTWALVEALRGQFSYAGSVLAARMLIGAGQRGLGALLRNESVANWLAKPTAADLEVINKLTPQQRAIFSDNLRPVIQQAQSQGMSVSPALAAIAGASVQRKTAGDILRKQ